MLEKTTKPRSLIVYQYPNLNGENEYFFQELESYCKKDEDPFLCLTEKQLEIIYDLDRLINFLRTKQDSKDRG